MFKFDWRMSQTCAHTLLILTWMRHPPPITELCMQPREARRALQRKLSS